VPPRLYAEFAAWWPLLSAPADYEEEAAFYQRRLLEACRRPCQSLLELGSGGGNNASHLKARFNMVLVDRSPGMLQVSRLLNPECEHVEDDMRTVRLGRQFDGVFVHDAVCYMTTEADLRQVIERRTCTANLVAQRCLRPIMSARTFDRPPTTVATTARTARCATWNGAGIRIPQTAAVSLTTPI
jgi:SAM-dependent methyltransferase